jgi:lipopolysaccharide/colanic/teichoic acid biosynthesis glycosyltransferase
MLTRAGGSLGSRLPSSGTIRAWPGAVDRAATRAIDVSASALLIVLLLPVMAVVAAAIKLESPGPVFFRCRRAGYRGHELWLPKFRKMHHDAVGMPLSLHRDERFTRVGRLLARFKLDELPQLFSVLKGDMSLVGPRPEDARFVELHPSEFRRILSVRPGITGLSQLAFAREGEILDPAAPIDHYIARILPQKISIDCFYAANRTVAMDMRVLLWTLVAVIGRRDVAINRNTGRPSLRRRRTPQPELNGDLSANYSFQRATSVADS